jgi:hypothetical protein
MSLGEPLPPQQDQAAKQSASLALHPVGAALAKGHPMLFKLSACSIQCAMTLRCPAKNGADLPISWLDNFVQTYMNVR